ncbi:aspartate/glutamate racemase family protein [Rhizobium sp. FKY42]|uniref:aspartate/glutamate racemase family protein n=1 Tax=Rhizobium sp. FKY42 TaxID=2562310 RepID=UPI0010BFB358|nr:aspartate/glutamate racemase family protein [Rhizobium sp. FKY42]
MPHITLINPNTSQDTTAMMTEIARNELPPGFNVEGKTARHGVAMILNAYQLEDAAEETISIGLLASAKSNGLIISAFGDPGLQKLRAGCSLPVVGICEASMLEATVGKRRFGIATVTPELVSSFAAKARALGVANFYTGTRLTSGNPVDLTGSPERLYEALEKAVRECVNLDGADVVIIGGGPLGQAAHALQKALAVPVIAPIGSAVRSIVAQIEKRTTPVKPST